MIEWRPYQTEMIESVFQDWQNHKSLLAVAATGAGKTNILFGIVDRFINENPGARVAILAHRQELISQPKDRLAQFWPQRAQRAGIVMANENDCHRQIIIATVQTLGHKSGNRLAEVLRYGQIDLLIIDEAHHGSAAQYRNVIENLRLANPAMKLLGVTATPERGDKKNLTEVFEKESANVGVLRLIDEGWLCEPRVHGVKTSIDLSGVNVVGSGGNRDYNQQQLVAAVETADCFKVVVKTHVEKCGDRPTIAFVPSVAGAYKLAELLQAEGIRAVAADGTTPKEERAQMLRDFKAGIHTTIVNCALFTEGLDLPQLECCHLVRPTKSDALYLQMVGRCLRIMDGKAYADIFDYQPLGARNLDMRLRKMGLKRKAAAPVAPREGGGSLPGASLHKTGDHVEYTLLDYFTKRREAWVTTPDGWRIVALGKGDDNIDRSVAVSNCGNQLWVVWRKEGERWATAKLYLQGEFDTVSGKAEEMIKKHANERAIAAKAPWRNGQPSESQVTFGNKLRVYESGMTKGQLSDAINRKLVMQAIKRADVAVAA